MMRYVAWLLLKYTVLFLGGTYLLGLASFMDKFKAVTGSVDVLFPYEIVLVWNLSGFFFGWAGCVAIQLILISLKGEKNIDRYFR